MLEKIRKKYFNKIAASLLTISYECKRGEIFAWELHLTRTVLNILALFLI